MALRMAADRVEGFLADVVFHFAGVRFRRFLAYTEIHKEAGQRRVPLQHFSAMERPLSVSEISPSASIVIYPFSRRRFVA